MNIRTGFVLLATAAVASGCTAIGQSDFSCSKPDGVTCMDAVSVYEVTNDPALEAALRAELKRLDAEGVENIDPYKVLDELKSKVAPQTVARAELAEPIKQPLPVLKPAEVVRIWIAPWVDKKGDLHMPGYVFSEITPRRWEFGEVQVDKTTVLAPVQVQRDAGRAE